MAKKQEKLRPHTLRLFFALFLGAGILLGGLSAVLYRAEIHSFMETAEERERFELELLQRVVEDVFDGIVSDLMFLAKQNELRALLVDQEDTGAAIAAEYLAFAAGKGIYDQIRFLDDKGAEQVRVNFNHGAPAIVSDDALQDKSRRYYFTDVIALRPGEVFVSPLDLNIERGVVERPFKPMIRIGTPVADASGNKRGIVLLNYLGADLLDRLLETATTAMGDVMLLNDDGYWLLAPDAEDAWGFMLPERAERSFAKTYPEEWKQIQAAGSGQVHTENGLFTFATLRPLAAAYRSSSGAGDAFAPSERPIDAEGYQWVLLLHMPADVITAYTHDVRLRVFLLGGGAFTLIAIGAWFLALAIVRRREYQKRLMTMAHYDSLTGLPNRTLFFDRLRFVHHNAVRYGRSYGLLYIDLDGFKDINDSLGHDAGDAVLREVASRIESSIRESDTVARLGGDELAVLLSQVVDIVAALALGDKLIDRIKGPITLDQGTAHVGASIGAALYPNHGTTSDRVLACADQAMYVAKSRGKGACVAFAGEAEATSGE